MERPGDGPPDCCVAGRVAAYSGIGPSQPGGRNGSGPFPPSRLSGRPESMNPSARIAVISSARPRWPAWPARPSGGLARTFGFQDSPNEKVRFACIGVGGKGESDTNDAGKHGQIVALCDVDETNPRQDGRQVPRRQEVRRLPQDARGDGRQDRRRHRQHARPHARPAAAMAMRMGKHAFVQKPLTWSVEEARILRSPRRPRRSSAPRWATRGPPPTASAGASR